MYNKEVLAGGKVIQIQHLLKLNADVDTVIDRLETIQIQHLLKLNVLCRFIAYPDSYSNTTLVKVKC